MHISIIKATNKEQTYPWWNNSLLIKQVFLRGIFGFMNCEHLRKDINKHYQISKTNHTNNLKIKKNLFLNVFFLKTLIKLGFYFTLIFNGLK